VRETLENSGTTGHGWLHTDRVRRNILTLAAEEGVDPVLAELAALLHDVGRTQPGPERQHGDRSATLAEPVLAGLSLTAEERQVVLHAVRWHNSGRDDTLLLCVLRDADMLDGLGALGLMRAFMSKSHLLPYDAAAPFQRMDGRWPAVFCSDQILGQMDWYARLNTDSARQMARDRISFMETFLVQVQGEIMTRDG
jgi:HD superfamily phosphodiesterase